MKLSLQEKVKIMTGEGGWDYQNEAVKPSDALYERHFGFKGRNAYDWRKYAPEGENQGNSVRCLLYSALNCHEINAIKKLADYGMDLSELKKQVNFSELWTALHIAFSANGTTFNVVMDAIRKHKLLLEKDLPIELEGNVILKQVKDKIDRGEVKAYDGCDYSIVATTIDKMQDAMADSPLWLGVPVYRTWDTNGIVKPQGSVLCYHGITGTFFDSYDKVKYIFDSFEPFEKKLSWDYPILYAKSITKLPEGWKSFYSMLHRIILNGKEQYSVDPNKLINRIPDEETLRFLLDRKAVSESLEPVSNLDSYLIGEDWASQAVYKRMRSIYDDEICRDAYRIAAEIKSGTATPEKIGWFAEIMKKLKGLFNNN